MHKPARSLGQRIVWACVILALLCASLFSFFNVIFVYTVEDQFFRHQLMDEEKRQLQQPELVVPLSAAMQILLSPQDFLLIYSSSLNPIQGARNTVVWKGGIIISALLFTPQPKSRSG